MIFPCPDALHVLLLLCLLLSYHPRCLCVASFLMEHQYCTSGNNCIVGVDLETIVLSNHFCWALLAEE